MLPAFLQFTFDRLNPRILANDAKWTSEFGEWYLGWYNLPLI